MGAYACGASTYVGLLYHSIILQSCNIAISVLACVEFLNREEGLSRRLEQAVEQIHVKTS